ncbi:MAG: hypothetical protein U9Q81_09105 [Pseudomonadota bacterium]|nr:hypothetical protein [Pseudomonadota bacterium]
MPHSAEQANPAGTGTAVLAQSLYVANLLVLPVVAFVVLVILFLRCDRNTPPLAAAHIHQAVTASLWSGILLVVVNGLILLMLGYQGVLAWTLVIIYFTVCHSTFVLLGIVGLSKAMAGTCWRFPLIGPRLPQGCAGMDTHG